jgi:hypothetical protein
MHARVLDHALAAGGHDDRRDNNQPSERMIGRIVACDGARATIAASATTLAGLATDFWSIGRLISISMGNARIVGLVSDMTATAGAWIEGEPNAMHVRIELAG